MLNGKLVDEPEDEIVQQDNKAPSLKTDKLNNGSVTYDTDTGEVISAVSEPKLVEKNTQTVDASEKSTPVTDASEKTTPAQSEKETSSPVLEEIVFDASMETPVDGEISATFGKREHPITKEVKEHNGVDIKAPEGTNVVSSISGTVTDVGFDADKGNYIVVENGNVKTLYAQLATTGVKKGDAVTAKQSIGTVGKTGKATGAHLHFEVMIDGEYCDPTSLIK